MPWRLKLWLISRARGSRSSGRRLRWLPCESLTTHVGRAAVERAADGGIGVLGHQLAGAAVLGLPRGRLVVAVDAADAFDVHRDVDLLALLRDPRHLEREHERGERYKPPDHGTALREHGDQSTAARFRNGRPRAKMTADPHWTHAAMTNRSRYRLLLFLLVLAGAFASPRAQSPTLRGFPDERRPPSGAGGAVPQGARRRAAEGIHGGDGGRAARRRPAGSRRVADYALAKFKSWRLNAPIEEFEAMMPWPTERSVELVAPTPFTLSIKEPVLPEDPDSGDADSTPLYNAYSGDGDVTGEVVYVNYGMPADYEKLEGARHQREGQDRARALRRRLARHQAEGRLRARRHRLPDLLRSARRRVLCGRRVSRRAVSAGVRRAARQRDGHAGASRAIRSRRAGAAKPAARRTRREDAQTILKIPVLPISYGDALPILQAAQGPGGAGGVARRAAGDVSRRPGPGAAAHEAGVRLEEPSALQRDRPHSRRDARPTSGSSSATTTTRG